MDTSNVDSVFVAGKALKRKGELLNVDLNNVRKMAPESRDYVVSKLGLSCRNSSSSIFIFEERKVFAGESRLGHLMPH